MKGNMLENDSNVLHYYCTCSYVDIRNLSYDVRGIGSVADFLSRNELDYTLHSLIAQDSKQMFLTCGVCIICIIEWNHVYTLEILNILCDPRYSILHLHLPYRIPYYIGHYNTTVKYVHFTMFYTGDGNDLIYPRCVSLAPNSWIWGTVGAFIYNYIL